MAFLRSALATFILLLIPAANSLAGHYNEPEAADEQTASKTKKIHEDFESATAFRRQFPAPRDLATLVSAFENANNNLLSHAQQGASAFVLLHYEDGTVGYGRDFYFSTSPKRLHEIRKTYEAIGVGDDVCLRTNAAESWDCGTREFSVAVHKIQADAVVEWQRDEQPCESGTCDVYRVQEANTYSTGKETLIASDPGHNYYALALVMRHDGTPVMLTTTQYLAGEIFGPPAIYIYDFNSPVTLFDLPARR